MQSVHIPSTGDRRGRLPWPVVALVATAMLLGLFDSLSASPGTTCDDDDDCTPDEICDFGICVCDLATHECCAGHTTMCAFDEICVGNICNCDLATFECCDDDTSNCASDEICQNNACVCDLAIFECCASDISRCTAGESCVANACAIACAQPSDCPAGTTCDGAMCVPDCNSNGTPDVTDIAVGTSENCNNNIIPDECDIAAGTSPDCNSNGIPDGCEIGPALLNDCNDNGILDECEPDCDGDGTIDDCESGMLETADCNSNGVPDNCDILGATSDDCDTNGVLDQCEIDAGTAADCNSNGRIDDCEVNEPAGCAFDNRVFDASLTFNSPISNAEGPPDLLVLLLAQDDFVVLEFLCAPIVDGPGPDLTVYEHPVSILELDTIEVLVSADRLTFFDVTDTGTAGVSIPGDELHTDPAFRRSYDIGGTGLTAVRFVKIRRIPQPSPLNQGGEGHIGAPVQRPANSDAPVVLGDNPLVFDLDAVGAIHLLPFDPDCNNNAVPDACDITGDTSEDCNTNAVPDECDLTGGTSTDCNTNGVLDMCEIAAGTSADCNSNGRPDTCDLCGFEWSPLGSGANGFVSALTVFDDGLGGGPALYLAGNFTSAGGVAASHIARWDGTTFAQLGTGLSGDTLALAVFDDGGGPALYAGGNFTTAGGVAANDIAKWDGANWSALGAGTDRPVFALTVFDDGGGPALYAGGIFITAGGVAASRIARWDGAAWSALGAGTDNSVRALTVFDDGGGPALYAGGSLTTAGSVPANFIAKWDGTNWSALGAGTDNSVIALTVFDDGGGPALYAGGFFNTAGGAAASQIARWDGAAWSALGTGLGGFEVAALAVFDDGGGSALYAGGNFTIAGGTAANRIARWDGADWSLLGSGMEANVKALAVFNEGGVPALFAGGDFLTAGGVPASKIARWGCSVSGANDCNTNAVPDDCEADCNSNGIPDDCDLADGTSMDCNTNAVPDECDLGLTLDQYLDCLASPAGDMMEIPGATSTDCNHNLIPDDCDIAAGTSEDCNTNAVPDICDLTARTSPDCNTNAVPDECDIAGITSEDCNSNGHIDACEIADLAGCPFVNRVTDFSVSPPFTPSRVEGPPNNAGHDLLADEFIVFEFLCTPIIDGPGPDLTVYEMPFGPPELDTIDVFVSTNGIDFVAVTDTGTAGVTIPGDETNTDPNLRRSYDIAGTGFDMARFVAIQRKVLPPAPVSSGSVERLDRPTSVIEEQLDPVAHGDNPLAFELDAVGVIHVEPFDPDCNTNAVPDSCDIAGDTSADCNSNAIPDECDIASGTSTDCNSNGVPDTCDLAAATSIDCNANQVPDECDLGLTLVQYLDCLRNGTVDGMIIVGAPSSDCNHNVVPDECDIAGATSEDCNSNAFPDECDIREPEQSFCCLNPDKCGENCEIVVGTSQDCNANAVPDECDIRDGTSPDTDLSEVPDECQEPARVDAAEKGSALFFPYAELTVDPFRSVGGVFADTFITLSNDYNLGPDVRVQMYFISGDTWEFADADITLTPSQPAYWSAWEGRSLEASGLNFDVLPAVTLPDGTVAIRGSIIAFAVNANGEEIRWNHLSGSATVVDYVKGTAWTYAAHTFTAHKNVPHGAQTGTPGVINLDGFEFEAPPAELLFNFFAPGAESLSAVDDMTTVTAETALTLMPAGADFTVTNGIPGSPIATLARYVIFNENENKKTNTRRCVTCWDTVLLDQFENPNWFLAGSLGTDMGKASVNGEESIDCDIDFDPNDDKELGEDYRDILSEAAALLGVVVRHLDFNNGNFDAAGYHLTGRGAEAAIIRIPIGPGGGGTDEAPADLEPADVPIPPPSWAEGSRDVR